MLFKIHNASAEISGLDPGTFDRWQVDIVVNCIDAEKYKHITKNHNKMMTRVSKFFLNIMKNEINVNCTMKTVRPYISGPNTVLWGTEFDVLIKDNMDEQLAYMIWWISSCKGREFEI